MLRLKKALCMALTSLVVVTTVFAAGCSTPKNAMTVDGREYSTGEYLAYLYNTYSMIYQQYYYTFYYYSQSGVDYWEELPLTYGEGESAVQMTLSEYIIQVTKDTIIYQKALENKMKELNISYDAEKLKKLEDDLKQMRQDAFLALGFNNEHYKAMAYATELNEYSLFFGMNGDRMSEQELREYFDENFLSYKSIEISLVDSNSGDLSDADVQKVMDRLNGYLETFNQSDKTSADFDKLIEQYQKEEDKDQEDEDDKNGEGSGDDTASGDDTSSGSTDATTTTDGTTTSADTTTTTTGEGDGEEEEEEKTDENRKDIDASSYSDEDFVKALKSVEEGAAKVVEYKKNGSTRTAALIFRMDPEADRGEGVDYFADKREDIIISAFYEDFQKEMKEYANTLSVEYNEKTIKMCKPKNLETAAA